MNGLRKPQLMQVPEWGELFKYDPRIKMGMNRALIKLFVLRARRHRYHRAYEKTKRRLLCQRIWRIQGD